MMELRVASLVVKMVEEYDKAGECRFSFAFDFQNGFHPGFYDSSQVDE